MLHLDNMKVTPYRCAGSDVCPAFGENFQKRDKLFEKSEF